jgi:ubiquinone/menaquinone biosynthesis C-methylase UbiE
MTEQTNWPLRLFNKSVLKQRKYKEITALLGSTDGLHCIDLGADNGVISYLLRQQGGSWKSADLDEQTVRAITEMVKTEVYRIDGRTLPFSDMTFDRVVVVDMLEHVPDDQQFMSELFRIMKPDGILIVNVPHLKNSFLRRLRLLLGQTDEKHGHLRPGYTIQSLKQLFGNEFTIDSFSTYSKFFSEFIDTLIVYAVSRLKRGKEQSQKGNVVTGQDLKAYKSIFKLYSLVYPILWLASQLDRLLVFRSGYVLIVKARLNKPVLKQAAINPQETGVVSEGHL